MNIVKHLERAALVAHARGEQWATYWTAHADAIRAVEPYDRGRYRRLVNRLLSLVVSGDTAGQTAVGDDDAVPWELDDQPSPHDSKTQARCLLPLTPMPEGKRGITTVAAGCSLHGQGRHQAGRTRRPGDTPWFMGPVKGGFLPDGLGNSRE